LSKQTEELAPTTGIAGFSPNDYSNVLAEYGITPETMSVPVPPTAFKSNLRDLCEMETPVKDEAGNVIKCSNHTGPMIFLAKKGESDAEGKYAGYDGFYIYEVLHPTHGKTIITLGRSVGETKPALASYWDTLTPGAWVQVAQMPTSKGFNVYQAIPVQDESGNLIKR
jgi:hypothetical protein